MVIAGVVRICQNPQDAERVQDLPAHVAALALREEKLSITKRSRDLVNGSNLQVEIEHPLYSLTDGGIRVLHPLALHRLDVADGRPAHCKALVDPRLLRLLEGEDPCALSNQARRA